MKRIRKWLVIILLLLAFQTATYFWLGPRQLKAHLLDPYFVSYGHHSDSIFVRDFYVTDCSVGEEYVHWITHQLSTEENLLKQTFGAKYVYVQPREQFSWSDDSEDRYNLVYYTSACLLLNWWELFNFFQGYQTEYLKVDHQYIHQRKVTYHWCLLFWVKTFEQLDSRELSASRRAPNNR